MQKSKRQLKRVYLKHFHFSDTVKVEPVKDKPAYKRHTAKPAAPFRAIAIFDGSRLR
jgi:hypothetical protein